jgi:hypothetical protein
VKTKIDADGGGEGSFNLDPNAGEHQVSTGGARGKKPRYNEVHYNAANTVLKVVLHGEGWGKRNILQEALDVGGAGNCNNRLWMKSITLSITCNALSLPANAVYDRDYPQAFATPSL